MLPCGRKCPKDGLATKHRVWRGVDFGGILVEIEGDTHRVHCRQHGHIVADVECKGSTKGTVFENVSAADVKEVGGWMNGYPRKVLGYKSSEMAYQDELRALGIAA